MRALAHRRVVASRAGDHAAQAEIVQNLGPVAAIDDGAVLGDVDRHVNLLAGHMLPRCDAACQQKVITPLYLLQIRRPDGPGRGGASVET